MKELIDMQPIQYSRDVLYMDSRGCEMPWRYFIKPFNTPELLRIVDVRFDKKHWKNL
ncbi:hypothetical protein [Moraxella ovis]|uniref:hypothetical protein n=1 Tax=Moraxella ovis TaxID=29433 RepID=UPI00142F3696|nr:hypothetical protein [Moraxella ovis]